VQGALSLSNSRNDALMQGAHELRSNMSASSAAAELRQETLQLTINEVSILDCAPEHVHFPWNSETVVTIAFVTAAASQIKCRRAESRGESDGLPSGECCVLPAVVAVNDGEVHPNGVGDETSAAPNRRATQSNGRQNKRLGRCAFERL
jgi:hypothetical protein